jgi:hypothetical protein
VTDATTTITTRQELIDYTAREWDTFVEYVDGLTDEQWLGPKDAAGWSVKDHVSHVTQWDVAVVELFRNGVPIQQSLGVPDEEWTLDDYDPMNARIRLRFLDDSVDTVKADRDATWIDLVSVLEALSDEQLATPPGELGLNVDDESAPTLLQELVGYLGGHYDDHLGYIRLIVETGGRDM